MVKALAVNALAAVSLSAALVAPAEAAFVGVPTGQHARVMNSVARAQQRNDAAIAHVRNSIAATRRRQF